MVIFTMGGVRSHGNFTMRVTMGWFDPDGNFYHEGVRSHGNFTMRITMGWFDPDGNFYHGGVRSDLSSSLPPS